MKLNRLKYEWNLWRWNQEKQKLQCVCVCYKTSNFIKCCLWETVSSHLQDDDKLVAMSAEPGWGHSSVFLGSRNPFYGASTCVSSPWNSRFQEEQEIFQPNSSFAGAPQPDTSLLDTLRSYLNAVSVSNRDVLYDPPAVHRLPGLFTDEWSRRQRLASLFWIIPRYRVFPASEIHPPLLFLPSLSLFLFF